MSWPFGSISQRGAGSLIWATSPIPTFKISPKHSVECRHVVSLNRLLMPSTPFQNGGWTRIECSLNAAHTTSFTGDSWSSPEWNVSLIAG